MVDVLKLSGVFKGYGEGDARVDVLKGVDLTLEAGEMVAIVGPSGCGKSTLMHVAGLLDPADKGRVWVRGEGFKKAKDGFVEVSGLNDNDLAHIRNRTMGFVYQYHHLLREFTALENVMMPGVINGKPDEARAKELLELVGLGHRLTHYPSQLSGGEQQRVAIARALMNKPQVLLADEPTGNLDPETADGVVKVLFDLVKKEGLAVLLVTHNPALAKKCGRVLKVDKGHIVE